MLTWWLTSQTTTSQPTSTSTSECPLLRLPWRLPWLPACLPACLPTRCPQWAAHSAGPLPPSPARWWLLTALPCPSAPPLLSNRSWPFTLYDDDRVMKMMGLHLPQPQLLAQLQQLQQGQGAQQQQQQQQLQPADRALSTEAAPAPHVQQQPGGPAAAAAAAAAAAGVQGMPRLTPNNVATGGGRLPTPALQLSPALVSPGAGLGSGVSAMELSSPHPAAAAATAAGSGVFQQQQPQQQPQLRPAQGPPQAAAVAVKSEHLRKLGNGLHGHDGWPHWPPAAGAGAAFVPNGFSLQQLPPLPQLRPAAGVPLQQEQHQPQPPRLQPARRLH